MKSNSRPMRGALIMVFLVALSGCQNPSSLPKELSSEGNSSIFSNEVSSSSNLEKAVSDLESVDAARAGTQSEAEAAEKTDSEQSKAAIGERGSIIDGQGIAGLTFLVGGMGLSLLAIKLLGITPGKDNDKKMPDSNATPETAEIDNLSEIEAPLPESCDEKSHVNEIIEQASNDQGS